MSRTKSYVMDLEEKLNEREREIRRRRRELAEFGVSVRTINKKSSMRMCLQIFMNV